MSLRHFLSPMSFDAAETDEVLSLAEELKSSPIRDDLKGQSIGMLFFNSSLRTRTSMDIGVHQLGGHPLTLNIGQGTWLLEHREDKVMDGEYAEHIKDAARVLSRYVDVLSVRAFAAREAWGIDKQDPIINGFARWSDVPVVNLEGAMHHPCQSLADLLTIRERLGNPKGRKIAITWTWHPKALPMAVPNSIVTESAKAGMDISLAHPPGWELDDDVMDNALELAGEEGGSLDVVHSMNDAIEEADVVYAKSWGSIAHYRDPETEAQEKQRYRNQWRIKDEHFADDPDRFFMHCLPVRRGVVVDGSVLDSDRNAAYDEAENRLHVQKAMLLRLLGKA